MTDDRPADAAPICAGPMYRRVDATLRRSDGYAAFRAGDTTIGDFAGFLDAQRARLVAAGVPDEDVDYAKRYPVDPDAFVDAALVRLHANRVIDRHDVDPILRAEARRRVRRYDHDARTTYIYPEETDLLAALTAIRRPLHIVFLGAYYGYWAAAALPALAACGGTATLVDPDPACCALAADNLVDEIARGQIRIICTTGEALLAQTRERYDMVVIDAELPRDHPDPAMRGKGVYAPLLAAVLPHLTDRALVVCHNILLDDATGAPAFVDIVARNRRELGPFLDLARTALDGWTEIASTEGIGVASALACSPCAAVREVVGASAA